jgi:predicted nucleotidyltransferase component of viral defense system
MNAIATTTAHTHTLSLSHSHTHTFYRESSLRKKQTLSIKGNNASPITIHSSTAFRSHHHHSSLSLSLFNLNLLIKAVNISFVLFISVLL